MKLAIVGVTGLVGKEFLEVLEERKIVPERLIPVASIRSVGKKVHFNGTQHTVVSMEDAINSAPDFALFSAGGKVSLEFAPRFAEKGTVVIDNSSAWRMDENIKLIVPEVNGGLLDGSERIIANPNCSTIQLVVALAPLHKAFGIRRLVISTYQSFTGTGAKAVAQYNAEKQAATEGSYDMAYPYPIFENCLPHCDVFMENGYTREELKLINETRKILSDQDIAVSATAVRVPVYGGHSESVNIEFRNHYEISEVIQLLSSSKGVVVQNDVHTNLYPMPKYAHKKDEVFVGRIRRDESIEHGLNLWIVADNLRKGAATNAIQIMEALM